MKLMKMGIVSAVMLGLAAGGAAHASILCNVNVNGTGSYSIDGGSLVTNDGTLRRAAAWKGRFVLSEHWRSGAAAGALFVPSGAGAYFQSGVVIGWARVS
jgi:hypothetical protein